MSSQLALQVDLAAAALVVLVLALSIWFWRRQVRFEAASLRRQRDSDIIGWSRRALDIFSSAEMILSDDYRAIVGRGEYEKVRLWAMRDIASCIDQGRLFFQHGDQEPGDRDGTPGGYKSEALDYLISTYNLLSKEAKFENVQGLYGSREAVSECKRKFISIVQAEVDPKNRRMFFSP